MDLSWSPWWGETATISSCNLAGLTSTAIASLGCTFPASGGYSLRLVAGPPFVRRHPGESDTGDGRSEGDLSHEKGMQARIGGDDSAMSLNEVRELQGQRPQGNARAERKLLQHGIEAGGRLTLESGMSAYGITLSAVNCKEWKVPATSSTGNMTECGVVSQTVRLASHSALAMAFQVNRRRNPKKPITGFASGFIRKAPMPEAQVRAPD